MTEGQGARGAGREGRQGAAEKCQGEFGLYLKVGQGALGGGPASPGLTSPGSRSRGDDRATGRLEGETARLSPCQRRLEQRAGLGGPHLGRKATQPMKNRLGGASLRRGAAKKLDGATHCSQ